MPTPRQFLNPIKVLRNKATTEEHRKKAAKKHAKMQVKLAKQERERKKK